MTHIKAGEPIRQLAQKRRKEGTTYLITALILIIMPVGIYLIWSINGLSVLGFVACWVNAILYTKKGHKLWKASQKADQGANGEETVSEILSPLQAQKWTIEYNIPIGQDKKKDDIDVFLQSPRGKCFVVSVKSQNAMVSYDGKMLVYTYQHTTSRQSHIRDAQRQAANMQRLQQVSFVTPIICFTQAQINLNSQKIQHTYVVHKDMLLRLLQRLG